MQIYQVEVWEPTHRQSAQRYEVEAPDALNATGTAKDWYANDFHVHDLELEAEVVG